MLPLLAAAPGPAPIVVVYPLIVSSGAPDLGASVSFALSAEVARKGDVVVKPTAGVTTQSDYLVTARKLGADYYVAGFASTTIGTQISAIVQLVSTKSGIVVWRTTGTYKAPTDALLSGDELHDAILQFGSLSVGSYGAFGLAPPSPSPSPARTARPVVPPAFAAPANPAVPPSLARVIPSAPTGPRVLVADIEGTAESAVRRYASLAIIRSLATYNMAGTPVVIAHNNGIASGLLTCTQTGADRLVTGSIATDLDELGQGSRWTARLHLNVYDCKNKSVKPLQIDQFAIDLTLQSAVDDVVQQEVKNVAGPYKN
jgi:hypothetical protein